MDKAQGNYKSFNNQGNASDARINKSLSTTPKTAHEPGNSLVEKDNMNVESAQADKTLENGYKDEKPGTSAAENKPTRSKLRVILLMSSLGLAVFLAALDQIIVATALPAISQSLGASSTTYAWIASAYLLANASSIPIWGRISDIFGRKPALLAANLIFMIGSLVAALAVNVTMLIIGRAIQGLGGGGLLVLANICISDIFSLRERGFYLSIIGGVWAIASSIGPLIGGAFSEYVTWRWCFWINLPCDAVSLVGLFFFLDVHNPRTPLLKGLAAIDWLGALMSAGGTIMLLLGLDFGGTVYPWASATVICLVIFGVVTWCVFFLIEWKVARFPLFPLRIFNSWNTAAILLVCFFHAIAYIGAAFYLPLYFQAVLGATPLLSGVWILALAVPLSIVSILTGVIILKTGHYLTLIIGGMVMLTLGLGLFIDLKDYQSWPRIVVYQIIASIGMAPVYQAPIVALQTSLLPKDIASGTAAFQFLRQLSAGIGVVLGQVILHSETSSQSSRLATTGISPPLLRQLETGNLVSAIEIIKQLENHAQIQAVRSVLTDGLSMMWIFFTCASATGLVASAGIGQRLLSKKHDEFKTGLQSQK